MWILGLKGLRGTSNKRKVQKIKNFLAFQFAAYLHILGN